MRKLILLFVCSLTCVAWAEKVVPAMGEAPKWPREYTKDGHLVVVYQPQIEAWDNYKMLQWRTAVSVKISGEKEESYGALHFNTPTETNKSSHKVLIKGLIVDDVHFPHLEKDRAAKLKSIIQEVLPKDKQMTVSLDTVTAYMNKSSIKTQEVKAKFEPPPIFYSDKPANLVIFLGKPKFEKIKDTNLSFAVNTNWDVLQEAKKYYLLNGSNWLMTDDLLKGKWVAVDQLPKSFSDLPDEENWSEVRKNIPGEKAEILEKIFVIDRPAELIITDGVPEYKPIKGTKLEYVDNSKSVLFKHASDGLHYYLVAGRWFKSEKLSGPWESATKELPEDFKNIPTTHEKASVLASVPGTEEADAAILISSIPQKARVHRKTTTLNVEYEGKPVFAEITGADSKIYYALNTDKTVLRVGNKYYACYQAVWFESDKPEGKWIVSIEVPKVIYSIPINHPAHNVAYVFIYGYDDEYVIVGYTSGYTGAYISEGVVVFGVGYWVDYDYYDDYYHYYYHHCHHYSYGCGAGYDYHKGVYYRGAYAYGPYGGAGRAAAYNPSTGTYARGAYAYGPNGSAYVKSAYNPSTGNYARRSGGVNEYGSWGKSVVSDGTDWAKAGYKSNWEKSVAGFKSSSGAKGIAGKNKITGESGFIIKDKHGDIYAGKDGKIYKKENGEWTERTKNDWAKVQNQAKTRPSTQPTTRPTTRPSTKPTTRPSTQPTTRPSTRPSTQPSTRPSSSLQDRLNRQSQMRRSAIRRTQTYQRSRSRSRMRRR
jgi:hypothetical protein